MQRLVRHPSSPAHSSLEIEAAAHELAPGSIVFRYRVTGDVRAVRLPRRATPRRTDELWRHTCFEAFVRPAGSARYFELNFAPSTQWAAYAFARYREPLEPPALEPPAIRFAAGDAALELEATVRLAGFAARDSALGLTAVIEDTDGRSSYWALEHPRPAPDFHDAAGWTSRLAAATDGNRA